MAIYSREKTYWSLILGFSVILGLLIVFGILSISSLHRVEKNLVTVVEVTNEKVTATNVMRDAIRLRAIALREARLSDDPFVRDELSLQHTSYATMFREARDSLLRFGLNQQEQELYSRFIELARISQPLNAQSMAYIKNEVEGDEVDQTIFRASQLQSEIMGILGSLIELELDYAKKAKQEGVQQSKQTRELLIFICLVIIVLGILVAFLAIKAVQRGTSQIHYHASHDALTGLTNRRDFENCLDQAIESARNYEHNHVILFMDLDNFKIINDTCGHAAGDSLLRDIGTLFKKSLRSTDTVARLGGDEFGLLLLDCELVFAQRIAEKLIDAVKEYRLYWERDSYSVGVSIGLVEINKGTDSRIEVMKHADTACYTAKNEGRNRAHIYMPDDDELEEKSRDIRCLSCIRKALVDDDFRLYAQLVTPTAGGSNENLRAEILLRLEVDGKIVLPGEFIPSAERFHLMAQVDKWVVTHVIEWLKEETGRTDSVDKLYINLSGASLNDPMFIDFLDETLSQSADIADLLGFEITENIAIRNLEITRKLISKLKYYGCSVSLDDFGVGMSSFSYLKTLSVNTVKIDGEFVRNITSDKVDHGIVRLINEFCHSVNMTTVAEYIESEEIKQSVTDIGVDYLQGNIIMAASPIDDLLKQ